nr:TetR-like C-terminal domain-containing protein [Streptomyces cellostaticus]
MRHRDVRHPGPGNRSPSVPWPLRPGSTAAVYSLFDGKDAAVRRGARQSGDRPLLGARLRTPSPTSTLYALAIAYRRWGGEHRHLCTVLFGGVQSFDPSDSVGTGDPVGPLLAAIERALTEKVLAGDATLIALSLWVALHGLVTIELGGALDAATAEATFRSTPRCAAG